MKSIIAAGIVLFVSFAVRAEESAVSSDENSPVAAKKPASLQAKQDAVHTRKDLLENSIRTLNKKKDCAGDGECEVLEMGARHCGGPSDFLVVSTQNPNFSLIKSKAIEYTAVEKEHNLLDPPLVCAPVPIEPCGKCVENQCTAGRR